MEIGLFGRHGAFAPRVVVVGFPHDVEDVTARHHLMVAMIAQEQTPKQTNAMKKFAVVYLFLCYFSNSFSTSFPSAALSYLV